MVTHGGIQTLFEHLSRKALSFVNNYLPFDNIGTKSISQKWIATSFKFKSVELAKIPGDATNFTGLFLMLLRSVLLTRDHDKIISVVRHICLFIPAKSRRQPSNRDWAGFKISQDGLIFNRNSARFCGWLRYGLRASLVYSLGHDDGLLHPSFPWLVPRLSGFQQPMHLAPTRRYHLGLAFPNGYTALRLWGLDW